MADGALQANRLIRLETPLGPDSVLFYKMHGTEGMSRLFEWSVEGFAPDDLIDETKIVGYGCTVEFECADGGLRHFHGICTDISVVGATNHKYHYKLNLRPHLWFLKLQSDSRIFSDMKVDEIIQEVLDEAGLTEYRVNLTTEVEQIHYCVQYQESNFDFVCRLMEKYGLFYFFQHESGKHTLCITDSPGEIKQAAGAERVVFNPDPNLLYRENCLSEISQSGLIATDTVATNEYDYEKVGSSMKAEKAAPSPYGMTGNALYDFRTSYVEQSTGEQLARVSLESQRARTLRLAAKGAAPGLHSGCRVGIDESSLPATSSELTCTAATHVLQSDSYGTSIDEDVPIYSGQYEFIPWDVQFRAPKITPWPRIGGYHTATVVGKEGEEIDVDDQGRIQVHFHWERAGKPSRRLRIAQPLAGKKYGVVNIPRIGHEVLVSFIDGDPDRPLVIGSVYNSQNDGPLPMPANKTQMGLRSNSSKGGGGANEIILEDKKDEEKLAMIAERDHTFEIKNDAEIKVGYDKTAPGSYKLDIFKDRTETVSTGDYALTVAAGNRTGTIAVDDTLTVGANQNEQFGANRIHTIGGSDMLTVAGARNEAVAMTRSTEVGISDALIVGGSRNVGVGSSMSFTVGSSMSTSATDISETASKSISSNAKTVSIDGSDDVQVTSDEIKVKGKKITIEATSSLTLKVGSSSVTMKSSSITMKSSTIKQN